MADGAPIHGAIAILYRKNQMNSSIRRRNCSWSFLSSWGSRKVFDGYDASSLHGRVQAGRDRLAGERRPAAEPDYPRTGDCPVDAARLSGLGRALPGGLGVEAASIAAHDSHEFACSQSHPIRRLTAPDDQVTSSSWRPRQTHFQHKLRRHPCFTLSSTVGEPLNPNRQVLVFNLVADALI
jgi:hypothetical protein